MRAQVQSEIGITCSAGISVNKIFAKLAAGMHKPNSQTVVPVRAIPELVQKIPLKKMRGLGGQLGADLEARGIILAPDIIARYGSLAALQAEFGDKLGVFLWKLGHGIHDEEVKWRDKPQSLVSAKSFSAIANASDPALDRMVALICNEIVGRLDRDFEQFHRRPSTLHISFIGTGGKGASRQMPLAARVTESPALQKIVLHFFRTQAPPTAYPLVNITLMVNKMIELAENESSILSFFHKAPAASAAPSAASSKSESSSATIAPLSASSKLKVKRHDAFSKMFSKSSSSSVSSSISSFSSVSGPGECISDSFADQPCLDGEIIEVCGSDSEDDLNADAQRSCKRKLESADCSDHGDADPEPPQASTEASRSELGPASSSSSRQPPSHDEIVIGSDSDEECDASARNYQCASCEFACPASNVAAQREHRDWHVAVQMSEQFGRGSAKSNAASAGASGGSGRAVSASSTSGAAAARAPGKASASAHPRPPIDPSISRRIDHIFGVADAASDSKRRK
jgi:DNA polymerase eta